MPRAPTASQGRTWGITLGRGWHEPEQRGVVLHTLSSSGLMLGRDQVSCIHYESSPFCWWCIAGVMNDFFLIPPLLGASCRYPQPLGCRMNLASGESFTLFLMSRVSQEGIVPAGAAGKTCEGRWSVRADGVWWGKPWQGTWQCQGQRDVLVPARSLSPRAKQQRFNRPERAEASEQLVWALLAHEQG